MRESVWLSLGSNLGDRRKHLCRATDAIQQLPGSDLILVSPLYETAPWGDTDQGPYLNAVLEIETALPPLKLLGATQRIEEQLGRERDPARRWGPRSIDIDLLFYSEQRCDRHELQLPHPRMHERAFVLIPLLDLRPGIDVPGQGPAAMLLEQLSSEGVDRIDDSGWYC